MRPSARQFALMLLLFNGISACFGGWMLMRSPDGSALNMTVDLLIHSPFADYLVPGIILFIFNGLLSLAITWLVVLNVKHYEKLIMMQGTILTGWIGIQMIMLQTINYLHILFGSVGLLLIALGLILYRRGIVT
jgi:hypothetical protein